MQEAAVVLKSQVFLRLPHTLEVLLVPGFSYRVFTRNTSITVDKPFYPVSFLANKTKNCASSARAQHPAYAPGANVDHPNLSKMARPQVQVGLTPCPLLDSSGFGRANVCFVLQLLEHPLQIVPAKAVQSRNPPLRCLTRHFYSTRQSQHKPSKASKESLPGF